MKPLQVYVAGASADRAAIARHIQDLTLSRMVEVTLDWTAVMANVAKPDSDLTEEERNRYARQDLEAIDAASVFWLVIPNSKSVGAWVELGYAIARNKLIITSGDHASIFTSQSQIACATHDAAKEVVLRLADAVRSGRTTLARERAQAMVVARGPDGSSHLDGSVCDE